MTDFKKDDLITSKLLKIETSKYEDEIVHYVANLKTKTLVPLQPNAVRILWKILEVNDISVIATMIDEPTKWELLKTDIVKASPKEIADWLAKRITK